MEIGKEEIKNLFEGAFSKLYENDGYLLEKGVNERCIVSQISTYIKSQLDAWGINDLNVDVEYNRHLAALKLNSENKRYIPDLVIHQRGTDDRNICCCEAKKNARENSDIDKIKDQMNMLHYRYGVVIKEILPSKIEYLIIDQKGKENHTYLPNK